MQHLQAGEEPAGGVKIAHAAQQRGECADFQRRVRLLVCTGDRNGTSVFKPDGEAGVVFLGLRVMQPERDAAAAAVPRGAKRRLRGTCPERGGAGGEKRAS